ncbi:hypothetical protein ACVW1C_001664 [Bradyrhizobium sp. USDA 4011]
MKCEPRWGEQSLHTDSARVERPPHSGSHLASLAAIRPSPSREDHRNLPSSAISVSRSLASSGASVSLEITSAFGAALSAIC